MLTVWFEHLKITNGKCTMILIRLVSAQLQCNEFIFSFVLELISHHGINLFTSILKRKNGPSIGSGLILQCPMYSLVLLKS